MEWVETTGRTVEAALDAALDQLGVDEDEVEFEVVQEPRGGFIGRRDARIRARVRPVSREKPGERRRRPKGQKGRSGSGGGGDRGGRRRSGGGGAGADRSGGSGGSGGSGESGAVTVAPSDDERDDATPASTPASTGASTGAKRRRRRGGRGRSGGSRPSGTTTGSDDNRSSSNGQEDRVSEDSVSVEEQAAAAADFTSGLIDAFAVDAKVSTRREDDDVVIVDVEGDDLGLLVGPKGATLQAIEELVRTVVQRRTEGHGARIHVDVGGYRAKRRAALERFALDLADQVKESGEDRALEPMSASDRKVVHDAVGTVDGVSTTSEGEEPRRRVVVRAG